MLTRGFIDLSCHFSYSTGQSPRKVFDLKSSIFHILITINDRSIKHPGQKDHNIRQILEAIACLFRSRDQTFQLPYMVNY